MPKILASYAVNVELLPPEGSEEWLAMLPGWSGWRYNNRYNEDYYAFWVQSGFSGIPSGYANITVQWAEDSTMGNDWVYRTGGLSATGEDSEYELCKYIGEHLYIYDAKNGWYYFAGDFKINDDTILKYAVARARGIVPPQN